MTYSIDTEFYLLSAPFFGIADEQGIRTYEKWNLSEDLSKSNSVNGLIRQVSFLPEKSVR